MSMRVTVIFAMILLLTGGAIGSELTDISSDLQAVVEEALPWVVQVRAEPSEQPDPSHELRLEKEELRRKLLPERWPDPLWDDLGNRLKALPKQLPFELRRHFGQERMGTGVILDTDGHILTVTQLTRDTSKLKVALHDGRTLEAETVGSDEATGLAVIRIEAPDLTPLTWGDSESLAPGQLLLSIGHSAGLDYSVALGVVSGLHRRSPDRDYGDLIQTDAEVYPGGSGGPLLNGNGEVVGIVLARQDDVSFSFAIPSNIARHVAEQLIQHGRVPRGWIGVTIQDVTPDLADEYALKVPRGALVSDVQEKSPAAEHGVETGDLILSVDGIEIRDAEHLRHLVALLPPGKEITLDIRRLRDGEKESVSIQLTLAERSDLSRRLSRAGKEARQHEVAWRGILLQTLTPELAKELGYEGQKGVLVTEVKRNTPGDRAGLESGDLILDVEQHPVSSTEEFLKQVDSEKGSVLLRAQRGDHIWYLTVK